MNVDLTVLWTIALNGICAVLWYLIRTMRDDIVSLERQLSAMSTQSEGRHQQMLAIKEALDQMMRRFDRLDHRLESMSDVLGHTVKREEWMRLHRKELKE